MYQLGFQCLLSGQQNNKCLSKIHQHPVHATPMQQLHVLTLCK